MTLNPSEANKRELAAAYDQKKKAQSGTGGRIVIEDLRLERVFVAAHKQYATEPLGRVRVRNDSVDDYKNLRCRSSSRSTWTFPVTREIPELKAKSTLEVPLNATFNNKVLGIDEDTRVLVVVTLAMADARDGAQEITQAMTLYGKNAIVWANSDMVGSFVTPRDDTLRNFVREAANRYAPPAQGALNRPLAQAATVFNTLSALGLRYQPDPNTPYSRVSADQVDYVQFPRETLRLKSGDCDDLSVLLAAAYENLGIETRAGRGAGPSLPHVPHRREGGRPRPDQPAGRAARDPRRRGLDPGRGDAGRHLVHRGLGRGRAQVPRSRRRRRMRRCVSLRQAWERYPPATLAPARAGGRGARPASA